MKRALSLFRNIEDWVSGILIAGGLGVMLYQVFLRYILDVSTTWQDEVSRYLVVWGALIGSAVAIRDNEHIRVDILYQYFSEAAKRIIDFFANLAMLIFFIFLIIFGFILVKDKFISGQASYSGFKLWIIFIALPLSGVLMLLQTLANIFNIREENMVENSETNIM